nr:pyrroline-5-carboxylate reductase [Leuconostoc sp.]
AKHDIPSPGGSTIRGVVALEKNGFRYAVMDAVQQANHE